MVKWDETQDAISMSDMTTVRGNSENLFIADVSVNILYSQLYSLSKQLIENTWQASCSASLSRLISHWASGGSITPCFIRPYKSQIVIDGGHHRLAICIAKQLENKIPVLFTHSDQEALSEIIDLSNCRNPV